MIAEVALPVTGKRTVTRRLLSNRSAIVAIALLFALVIPCLAAPLFAPYSPIEQQNIIELKNHPPSALFPFGTDQSSRDVLSRVLYGGRVSLAVAFIATLVSITLGTAYGAIAGFTGGVVEAVMMRMLDALLSIPRLLLLIAIFAAWRNLGVRDFVVIVGLTGWYGLSRIVRGQVLAIKGEEFVLSARALGASRARILLKHILPNILTPVIVAASLGVGHVILLEAGLSYLGIGVQPPDPSWGTIIQDGSDQITSGAWWISFFPGMAIVLTVMAFNVLGDTLREALQPRHMGSQ